MRELALYCSQFVYRKCCQTCAEKSVDVNCKPLLLQELGLSLTGRQTHRVGQLFHKQGGIRSFPHPDPGSVDPDLDAGA